jgi:hypothetical protein
VDINLGFATVTKFFSEVLSAAAAAIKFLLIGILAVEACRVITGETGTSKILAISMGDNFNFSQ